MSERGKRPRGTGRVFVKHGSYYGSWRVGKARVTRKIGAVRQPGAKDGLTQTMAEKRLRVMMEDSSSAPAPVAERMTVADVGRRVVAHMRTVGRKENSINSVESITRMHLAPYFEKAIADITEEQVEAFISEQRESGRAVNSVITDCRVLSRIINYAISKHWAPDFNPVSKVEMPSDPDEAQEIRYLTREELEALFRAAGDCHRYTPLVRQRVAQIPELREAGLRYKDIAERFGIHPATLVYYKRIGDPDEIDSKRLVWSQLDRALYIVAAWTGLRQGELIALRWRDVDWTAQVLRVSRNYALGKFGTTKGGRVREVPMADVVGATLDDLSKREHYTARDELVFGQPQTGKPLDRSVLLRRYKATLVRAGQEERPFHDLRHTFGTMMASSPTISMRDLQEWMGHRDSKTTERYAAFRPRPNQAAQINDVVLADSTTDSKLSETHTLSELEDSTETGGSS